MLSVVLEVRMEPSIIDAYEQIDVACRPPDFPVVALQLGELSQGWWKVSILSGRRYYAYGVGQNFLNFSPPVDQGNKICLRGPLGDLASSRVERLKHWLSPQPGPPGEVLGHQVHVGPRVEESGGPVDKLVFKGDVL